MPLLVLFLLSLCSADPPPFPFLTPPPLSSLLRPNPLFVVSQVREANFWGAMRRQHASAVVIQAHVRGHLARLAAIRALELRNQLRQDALQYSLLIGAVRRSVAAKREADVRMRAAAATRLQAAQRGKVGRAYAARRRVERPVGLTELREWSHDLLRRADCCRRTAGVAHLGTTLSRSELDELQLEAATDHAFAAHELGMPVTGGEGRYAQPGIGGGGGGSIRPILVFDCHAPLASGGGGGGKVGSGGDEGAGSASALARLFPMELETASGRRRALLRQEMRGLAVDRETRRVLSRPLHQLWALGERPELRLVEESWLCHPSSSAFSSDSSSASHGASAGEDGQQQQQQQPSTHPLQTPPAGTLLEDPLGELVHFWQLGGRVHAVAGGGGGGGHMRGGDGGVLGGPPAPAARVEEFIAASRLDYAGFAHCALTAGLTPIFRWWAGQPPSRTSTPPSGSLPRLVLVGLRSRCDHAAG